MNALSRWLAAVCSGGLALCGPSSGLASGLQPADFLCSQTPLTAGIAVGDVEGDSATDRVYLEPGRRTATVRFALSGGTALEPVAVPSDSRTIAALDLDNDRDLDVLIVSRSGRLIALFNQGNGEFWPKELPVPNRVAPIDGPCGPDAFGACAAGVGAAGPPLAADIVTSRLFTLDVALLHVAATVPAVHSPPRFTQSLRGPPDLLG
jgi:hypothetical protein